MRCGNNPDVGLDRRAPADGRVFALLQNSQQPRLGFKRHVANFVEEKRSAFSLFETARYARLSPCECPLLVAKKFTFDKFARDRGHIDCNERALPALAVIM